ncbi:hypothetical protein FRC09_005711 [Ceratobasidium sp. 395]|nr:hypothetical protein FRC09_005711 [Ceratobasidium sp. 395]
MKEIEAAAQPHVIPKSYTRTQSKLLAHLRLCPAEVQQRVSQAAQAKKAKSLAKKRQQQAERSRRRRSKLKEESAHNPPETASSTYNFLGVPTEDQRKSCRRDFLAATSNEALSHAVCASCARKLFQNELTEVDYLSLKNRHVFHPTTAHPDHTLFDGMLLEPESLDAGDGKLIGWICKHCYSAHNRNNLPAFSLANDMWTGPAGLALSQLSISERLLIALRFPRGLIIKLYPRGGRGSDHPDTLQSALRGNVTTYHTNAEDVVRMLEGQLMPRKTSILPSLIAITFIGRGSFDKEKIKPLFRVRRDLLYEALLELKEVMKHPGYVNLDIDRKTLDSLPTDDVPDEIYAVVRQDTDEGIVARESAGYVPPDLNNGNEDDSEDDVDEAASDNTSSDQMDLDFESSMFVSDQMDLDFEPSKNSPHGPEEPDVIPLEYSGMSAADGSHITKEELLRNALRNLAEHLQTQMSNEGGYLVRHGGFARDFGPSLSKESEDNIENPSVYTFVHLFSRGVGGLEAKRKVAVSFGDHVRCLIQRNDPRFRMDANFICWAFALLQKRQAMYAAQLTMSRRDFDRVCATLSKLTPEALKKAAAEEEKGLTISDPRVMLLKKLTRATLQKVMGSDASRALNRSKIWSTSLYLNPVNLWMTLNFIDRHDPICQVFAGENINMDDLSSHLAPSSHQRAKNVAEDPFAATQFFFFLANTVLKTLFGFSTDKRLGENRIGELGLGNAYFGVVEAQGRGSLHLHLMMWLANSPNADEITVKLKSPEFQETVKAYLRQNIKSHLDGLTEDALDTMEPDSELAWSRPPHPDSPTYDQDMRLLELKLA